MQGDTAPCGTTDRDAAASPLLNHTGSAFRSPFSSISSILWFPPHMQSFFCGFPARCARAHILLVSISTLAVLRVALFGVFGVFCGFLYLQCLKGVFDGGCIILWDVVY